MNPHSDLIIVGILLRQDELDLNKYNKSGETQLFWGAKNRKVGIFKILLERNDVSPNMPDRYGETLLYEGCSEETRVSGKCTTPER